MIADAVFARPDDREMIEHVAESCSVPFTGIWLDAPANVLVARTSRRRLDASDADIRVVRQQLAAGTGALRWPGIDAARDPREVLATVRAAVAAGDRHMVESPH